MTQDNNDPYFIHSRLAADMDARLQILNRTPKQIILFGADGDHSRSLLASRYPQARFSEYDSQEAALQAAALRRRGGLWAKLSGKNIIQTCQSTETRLPENSAEMLWANLGLMNAADAVTVLQNWSAALKKDGLLFFSHFGADSLPEIRQLLQENGIRCAAPLLKDMHDWGDLLFEHGFNDPVMDTAKMVLDYQNTRWFWQDLTYSGLWQALQAEREEDARAVVERALSQGQLKNITLEILFGHAVKKTVMPAGEQEIRFYRK